MGKIIDGGIAGPDNPIYQTGPIMSPVKKSPGKGRKKPQKPSPASSGPAKSRKEPEKKKKSQKQPEKKKKRQSGANRNSKGSGGGAITYMVQTPRGGRVPVTVPKDMVKRFGEDEAIRISLLM